MDSASHQTKAGRQVHRTINQMMQRFRLYYQSFLLHFLLGLSITVLLLISVIALNNNLPSAVWNLNTAVVMPTQRTLSQSLSQTVFSHAVYLPPGSAERYFSLPETKISRPNSFTDRPSAKRLQNKDETEPLKRPSVGTGTDPNTQTDTQTDMLYASDTAIPKDHTVIRPTDLSQKAGYNSSNEGILFSNQTAYSVNAKTYLSAAYPIEAPLIPTMVSADNTPQDASAPLVLILHTHGTEAYAPDGASSVPSGYPYRSEDPSENIVSVGAALAKTLQNAGISVLHCTTMFDAVSYTDSYVTAAAYIRETVAAYPSIQYVFDVHRDALQASDGSMLRPVTSIGEEVCAQIMSVVGTDDAGGNHPHWRDNLTIAVHLQKRLNEAYTSFTRPINLRTATFNAQYAPGSLLLEIGAAGNSVEEARSAAYHLGLVLADMILHP